MPFSAENWPTITPFKDGETRVASDSEFGDFTTLLVIRPEDSTRIELNPQPTAPLPQEGFGMKVDLPLHISALYTCAYQNLSGSCTKLKNIFNEPVRNTI